jgi:hypothetical protein
MKNTIIGCLGLSIAYMGDLGIATIAYRSWAGLICSCAIFVGGILFGKFLL